MKILFNATTRGGKYELRCVESPMSDLVYVESLTNGVIRGSMGPVSHADAAKWAAGRMREAAEIDGIHYHQTINLLAS